MNRSETGSTGDTKDRLRSQTCCFTGHRRIPAEDYAAISERLERIIRELYRQGILYYGAGGALGFDTLVADTVLRLREELPEIRLILVLPCLNQTKGWAQKDVEHYEDIKNRADKVVYTSREYAPGCMHKRNRHLVDYSSVCIAYLTHSSGGTAYTVGYAREQGVRVVNVAFSRPSVV